MVKVDLEGRMQPLGPKEANPMDSPMRGSASSSSSVGNVFPVSPLTAVETPKKIARPSSLRVEEVSNPQEREEVCKTLQGWAALAQGKKEEAQRSYPEHPATAVVKDNHELVAEMAGVMAQDDQTLRLLVCRDDTGKIVAAALYNRDDDEVGGIVTHPDNVEHLLNAQTDTRVRGAGTAIAVKVFQECLAKGQSFRLVALKSAYKFYQALGMEHEYPGSRRMVMTCDKIKALLSRLGYVG